MAVLGLLLVASCLLLLAGSAGNRFGSESIRRTCSSLGFLFLSVFLGVLTFTASDPSRHVIPIITAGGGLICLQATALVWTEWPRADQLTITIATMLAVLLPFEIYPVLEEIVRETLTSQVKLLLAVMGVDATVTSSASATATLLTFENDAHLNIVRACTGIDGFALFFGLLVGARTTIQKKLRGILFAFVAVYLVNVLRLVILSGALAGEWLGSLPLPSFSLQARYYIAEYGIGLPGVIIATVIGFMYVAKWIPDLQTFVNELILTFLDPRSTYTESK